MSHEDGSRRAIVAAFLANLGIAVAKFVGFVVTGSASLAAEAIHSLADTGNQGLLFLGQARARRRPTDRHPFGFGSERYFWAFVVALVLFTGGGLFALFEAEEKLRHPHELESVPWAIGILLVAVVLEGLSLRTAVRESVDEKEATGLSWFGFVRHSKRAELTVVLLEDTGALLGLGFALAGVTAAAVTGNARFDALGSLGIGILLVVIAGVLATEMKSLLVGEGATPDQVAALRDAIDSHPAVRRVVGLRTLQLAPDELIVAAEADFDPALGADAVARAIDEIEVEIRNRVPEADAGTVYIEPELAVPPSRLAVRRRRGRTPA
ncbi:MAG TPA: cation diffusion facilitator family transporter [Acidimicrobiales bacterium]